MLLSTDAGLWPKEIISRALKVPVLCLMGTYSFSNYFKQKVIALLNLLYVKYGWNVECAQFCADICGPERTVVGSDVVYETCSRR